MRTWLKSLATAILARKAKNLLKHSHARRFLVIGGNNRFIMKDELAELLDGSAVSNKPGYTYKLGLALTILGKTAGIHSIFRWIKMVFSKSPEFTADNLIVDFVIDDRGDANFISDVLKPDICIVADFEGLAEDKSLFIDELESLKKQLPNLIIIAPDNSLPKERFSSGVVWYGSSDGLDVQLVEKSESAEGQTFRYRIGSQSGQEKVSAFGDHYIYPRLIFHYMNNHGLGQKK